MLAAYSPAIRRYPSANARKLFLKFGRLLAHFQPVEKRVRRLQPDAEPVRDFFLLRRVSRPPPCDSARSSPRAAARAAPLRERARPRAARLPPRTFAAARRAARGTSPPRRASKNAAGRRTPLRSAPRYPSAWTTPRAFPPLPARSRCNRATSSRCSPSCAINCRRICSISAGVKRGFSSARAASRISSFLVEDSPERVLRNGCCSRVPSACFAFFDAGSEAAASPREQVAQARHVAIVLRQRAAEECPPCRWPRNTDSPSCAGCKRRAQRRFAGIRDRPRRQPSMLDRCYRANRSQVLGTHIFLRMSRQRHRILHRGIALQRIAPLQPVVETRRPPAAALRRPAFRAPPATRASRPPAGVNGAVCGGGAAWRSASSHTARKFCTMRLATCSHVVWRVNSYVEGKRNPSRLGACGARSEISEVSCAAARKSVRGCRCPCCSNSAAMSYIVQPSGTSDRCGRRSGRARSSRKPRANSPAGRKDIRRPAAACGNATRSTARTPAGCGSRRCAAEFAPLPSARFRAEYRRTLFPAGGRGRDG